MITIRAAAKINLNLLVTGRRDDGMHLIDSLAVFADLADRITITADDEDHFTITGPMAGGLDAGADNLVITARDAFRSWTGWQQHIRINLEKNIPVAAGIGGGSADAAAVLNGLNQLSGAGIDAPTLRRIGLGLGADIPLCLTAQHTAQNAANHAQAWRMQGIGEIITLVTLPQGSGAQSGVGLGLVLINSGISVATADVFRTLARNAAAFDSAADYPPQMDPSQWLSLMRRGNSLAAPALAVCPPISTSANLIREIADRPSAIHFGMSGSGATFFAVFDTPDAAISAVQEKTPPCWHWAGGLFQPVSGN